MGEAVPIKPQRQTTEKNKYSAIHIKASLEFSLKPIVLRTYKEKNVTSPWMERKAIVNNTIDIQSIF